MGMPASRDPLPVIFGDSLYCIAQLSAELELRPLAGKVETPRKGLRTLVIARTDAADRTVIAEAARDRAFQILEAKVEVLQKKVEGIYAEAPKKAALIFKANTKKMFNSSVPTRNGLLEDLARAVSKPGLDAGLKAHAKEFVDARDAWRAAIAAHDAAQDAEAEAIDAVSAGKDVLIAGMVEVHGLLLAKYSTNVSRAERYFRRRTKKVTAEARAIAGADRAAKAAAKAKADAEVKADKAAKAAAAVKPAR
jgi:hypothetical protein